MLIKNNLCFISLGLATSLLTACAQPTKTVQEPPSPTAATQTKYMLCIGEYEQECVKKNNLSHNVFRYCPVEGTTLQMNADWVCARTGKGGDGSRWFLKGGPTNGNKCGYTHVEVICFDN